MFCSNCGAATEEGTRFCDQCGQPLGRPEVQGTVEHQVGQEPTVRRNAPEGKKRKRPWVICGSVVLAAILLVLLALVLSVVLNETGAAAELPEPVLDHEHIHIEIGREYSLDELLKYDIDATAYCAEEGEFGSNLTHIAGLITHTDSLIFGAGPVYTYSSYVRFYMIGTEDSSGEIHVTDDLMNVISQDEWDEEVWQYKYVVRSMDIRTEGVSFAGITVGDKLGDVLARYPTAVCTSPMNLDSNNINRDYASTWHIYTDGDGNLMDAADYYEETRMFESRTDLWDELLAGDPMLDIGFFIDEEGTVRRIHVRVSSYYYGSAIDYSSP